MLEGSFSSDTSADDVRVFLIQKLQQLKDAREIRTTPSSLFTKDNLQVIFAAYDRENNGFITHQQYIQGKTRLCTVSKQLRSQPLMPLGYKRPSNATKKKAMNSIGVSAEQYNRTPMGAVEDRITQDVYLAERYGLCLSVVPPPPPVLLFSFAVVVLC